jgi:hypothetical protein
MSYEGAVGLLAMIVVEIASRLQYNRYLVWGLFLFGFFLISDSFLRGDWVKGGRGAKGKALRGALGMAVILAFFGAFSFFIYRRGVVLSDSEGGRGQMRALLANGEQLYGEGCSRVTSSNASDPAPLLLKTDAVDWSDQVQTDLAIHAPERLLEFEKSVIWTAPEATNYLGTWCTMLGLKLSTLSAIIDNKPSGQESKVRQSF